MSVAVHPYWAVTNAEGRFKIEGLPRGRWQLVAWHPDLGTTKTAVEADRSSKVDLRLRAPPAPGL